MDRVHPEASYVCLHVVIHINTCIMHRSSARPTRTCCSSRLMSTQSRLSLPRQVSAQCPPSRYAVCCWHTAFGSHPMHHQVWKNGAKADELVGASKERLADMLARNK